MLITKEGLLTNRTNPCSTSCSNLLVTLSILSIALSKDHCQKIRSHKVCVFRGWECSFSLAKLVDRVNVWDPEIPVVRGTPMVRQLLEKVWDNGNKNNTHWSLS
jgi:hypothetical protein